MKILVIEDELLAAERLITQIFEVEPTAEIVGKLESVRASLRWFAINEPPHLIFMDVQLADGLCFEIFEKIAIETPVIFTTAYNEYALKAFKVNSIDYLLKPIDTADLENALLKFTKLHKPTDSGVFSDQTLFKKFMDVIQNPYKTRFIVRIGEHIKAINCEDITFFFSSGKSTFLRTIHNRDYGLDNSLDQLEKEIDPTRFYRVNRQQMVALEYIKDIIAYSGSRLKLIIKGSEEEEVIVSREKVAGFKIWLEGK